MTENDIWEYDNLEIDEKGFVTGIAYTREFLEDYQVHASVASYEYERRGKTKMNHVPQVTITDSSGKIMSEPEVRDSGNAEAAIENAKGLAEYIFEYPEDFVSPANPV